MSMSLRLALILFGSVPVVAAALPAMAQQPPGSSALQIQAQLDPHGGPFITVVASRPVPS